MKTTFNTTEYEASHGRKPRGLGAWAFRIIGTDGSGSYTTLKHCYFTTGTYMEAKRNAKSEGTIEAACVGRVRELVIEVLP